MTHVTIRITQKEIKQVQKLHPTNKYINGYVLWCFRKTLAEELKADLQNSTNSNHGDTNAG